MRSIIATGKLYQEKILITIEKIMPGQYCPEVLSLAKNIALCNVT